MVCDYCWPIGTSKMVIPTELSLFGCRSRSLVWFDDLWDFGDDALAQLAGLTNLPELDLTLSSELTDVGLGYLAALTSLRALGLSECENLTDDGSAYVAGVTNLQRLNLSR